MAYLSNRDFYKEFENDNLLIFPFKYDNIKGASINLTVSKFAWDINTNKPLTKGKLDKKEWLIVPSFATVAIVTQEVVYISKKICGTCHSKVGMTTRGFSHISTTLDPGEQGVLLVCFRNNDPVQKKIFIGETFVTLMLSYVKMPVLDRMIASKNSPGQRGKITTFEDNEPFFEKQERDGYHDSVVKLKNKMKENKIYKKWKEQFKKHDLLLQAEIMAKTKRKNKKFFFIQAGLYIISIVVLLVIIGGVIEYIEYKNSGNEKTIDYKLYVPLITIVIVVVNDGIKKLRVLIEEKLKNWMFKNDE
jgi:deoxycytidine triphosphate deaminase